MSTQPDTAPGAVVDSEESAVVDSHLEGSPAPSRTLEIVFAGVALALMVVVLLLSISIPLRQEPLPGQISAQFWPTLLSIIGLGLALWRLVVAVTAPPEERDDLERIQLGGIPRLLWTLGLTFAYIALWNIHSVIAFGYRINLFIYITAIFLAALMWLYGARKWTALILYPVVTAVGIYYLFGTLLRIPL